LSPRPHRRQLNFRRSLRNAFSHYLKAGLLAQSDEERASVHKSAPGAFCEGPRRRTNRSRVSQRETAPATPTAKTAASVSVQAPVNRHGKINHNTSQATTGYATARFHTSIEIEDASRGISRSSSSWAGSASEQEGAMRTPTRSGVSGTNVPDCKTGAVAMRTSRSRSIGNGSPSSCPSKSSSS
jgi:hypothetical protein